MEATETTTNVIKSIYKKHGFLDHYGGSLFITVIVCLVFFIAISYFYTMSRVKPIKQNWVKERCNPTVLPFAGFINKDPTTSTLEFTSQNFTSCINNILINIAQETLKPIHYAMSSIGSVTNEAVKDVNMVRKKIEDSLKQIASIDSEIMGRILNFLMPVHKMLVKMMSISRKVQGTLVTGFYNVIIGYLGIHSFVGAFTDILIAFLVTLAALILPLLFFFFTIPLAIPPLLIFTVIAAYTTVVIVGLSDVLHMTQSSVPPKPRCFDGNTIIYDASHNPIKIKDVAVGTKLIDGSHVTSTFVLSSAEIERYDFCGIIVSGNHYVLESDGWTTVSELEGATKIEDYREEYIYCINTTNKLLCIKGIIFSDWDSLDDMDIIDIRVACKNYLPEHFTYDSIHECLVGGFDGSTMIELENGESLPIKDVEVNDVMRFGERILGKVVIDARKLDVKKYKIGYYDFISGPNNVIYDNELGVKSTLNMEGECISDDNKPKYLYHLVTDTDRLTINGVQFCDFDGSLEQYLSGPQIVYLIQ